MRGASSGGFLQTFAMKPHGEQNTTRPKEARTAETKPSVTIVVYHCGLIVMTRHDLGGSRPSVKPPPAGFRPTCGPEEGSRGQLWLPARLIPLFTEATCRRNVNKNNRIEQIPGINETDITLHVRCSTCCAFGSITDKPTQQRTSWRLRPPQRKQLLFGGITETISPERG